MYHVNHFSHVAAPQHSPEGDVLRGEPPVTAHPRPLCAGGGGPFFKGKLTLYIITK